MKQNQGNDGSICQFEGFRKVQRIRSDFQTPFAFEGAGYLDPYVDPSKADLNLWTTPSRTDLGTVLTRHLSKGQREPPIEVILRSFSKLIPEILTLMGRRVLFVPS